MARRAGHVFISYKREEADTARMLRDALEADGFATWWDEDIQTGQQWAQALDEAVKGATAIVVLWSKRSVGSKWVTHEASVALAHDNYAPARIELVAIPTPYDRVQATDLLEWDGDTEHAGYVSLVRRLDELMPMPTRWPVRVGRWLWGNAVAIAATAGLLTVLVATFQVLQRIQEEASKPELVRMSDAIWPEGLCHSSIPHASTLVEQFVRDERSLAVACLTGADLRTANLNGAILRHADLKEADLTRADLKEADLTWANLHKADLTWANLHKADLTMARLIRAVLEHARLIRAQLTEANLTSANLHGASLTGADLQSAKLDGAVLTHADLTRADLQSANLNGADLRRANLTNARRFPDDPPIQGWTTTNCEPRFDGDISVCLTRAEPPRE
ncbi:MAG: pentapeptide repeat-containing protein [Myxococcota bacterium]